MWSSVLVFALVGGLDPIRLGWTLLVVSRPRPMQNLLAYWAGTVLVSLPFLLVPLLVLHSMPFVSGDLAHSSTTRHLQIGFGVIALSIAVLIAVHPRMRRRERAQVPATSGSTSTRVLESDGPTAIWQRLGYTQDPRTEGESAFRRLIGRALNEWENGALWVPFVIGVLCVPPPDGALFLLAITATAGAPIGTQILAAIVFVLGTVAVVEIVFVSYLITPAKTLLLLERLHDWAFAHRRHVLIAMFTGGGIIILARGMGII